jgi:hypothetical protein
MKKLGAWMRSNIVNSRHSLFKIIHEYSGIDYVVYKMDKNFAPHNGKFLLHRIKIFPIQYAKHKIFSNVFYCSVSCTHAKWSINISRT